MGKLSIKRIYAAAEEIDGQRILVDRLWPRGVSRSDAAIDAWEKEVAPSPALRNWFDHNPVRFPEFSRRYRAELDANPGPVERLRAALHEHDLTLVYAARDERCNHARVLADYLVGKGAN